MKKSLQKLFAMATVALMSLPAWAVMPQAGKVYRVVNKAYSTALSDNGPTGNVGCSAVNETSNSQRWLVSAGANGALRFRSLGAGGYLASSRARSQAWNLSASPNGASSQFNVIPSDGDYVVRPVGDGANLSMHCDGQSVVVCWDDNIMPSKWDFVEIPMTQAEIDAALDAFKAIEQEVGNESKYQTAMGNLFQDAACTVLKANYQSMTDDAIKADANYQALSAPLQSAVLKAKNGDWSETCSYNGKSFDWDSEHAKKYRVQLYEPYSEGEAAAVMAGIQAYTNMSNPSGIVGNSGDILYVMVEGEIKDGASLYLTPMVGAGMFNNPRAGIELHSGLNVVPIYSDQAHQLVNYTIYTTQTVNGRNLPVKGREIDKYNDLKIHIEGGQLNGFFNYIGDELYTPDTRKDYEYTSERATFTMYNLIGKYVILHLFLEDTPVDVGKDMGWGLKSVLNPEINGGENKEYDPAVIMKGWDDLCFRERTVMGIQRDEELLKYNEELLWGYYEPLTGDKIAVHPAGNTYDTDPGFQYGDYFNNRMLGITMQGGLYMNATWWRTAYSISTMNDILCKITREAGPIWGPAHEYGHMNQGPMKMAGTTEESNNIFSNVCVYYAGLTTSRSDMPSDQLNVFNRDGFYLENDTWGTTRMFLQLWLYYHACGKNKKFYPRLYELLRKNPLQRSYYYNIKTDHIQFVRMACLAAQEDLTDYFESWGFFRVLDNYHIGDYSNNYATLTQKDIDEVKAEIKSWNLPKNNQIIFIDDRPGSTRADWTSYMSKSRAGKFGGLEDFRNNVKASGTFSCTMRNDSLIIDSSNGTPGVGFIVYDEDGNLLCFTNDLSCPLKKAAAAAIMQGKAKIYAVGADGAMVEVVNDYLNAPIAEHLSNLHKLIDSTADIHDILDPTETRVGWMIPSLVEDFTAAYDAAMAADDTYSKDQIAELYLKLLDEYNAVKAMEHAKVPFVRLSVYKIYNSRFPTHCLASTSSRVSCTTAKTEGDEHQQWKLTASGDGYTLFNQKWQKYIAKPTEGSKTMTLTDSKNEAAVLHLQEVAPGRFLLASDGEWSTTVHQRGEKAGGEMAWENGSWDASRWILEIKEANENYAAQSDLNRYIAEAQQLLEKAGKIGIEGDVIDLVPEMISSNAPMLSGEDRFTGFDVLFDENLQTYFQSNTDDAIDSEDGLNHYLLVDLGAGNEVKSIQVNWTNRDVLGGDQSDENASTANVNAPSQIQVAGSADGVKFTDIVKLTGLPTGNAKSYSSPLIADGNSYRFYRFMNVAGTKKACGHPYFAVSEFGLMEAEERATPKACYPKVTGEMMYALRDQIAAATAVANKSGSKASKYEDAKKALLIPLNILKEAMKYIVAIDEVQANAPANVVNGIYDLSGRRVAKATRGHIYIINGQKVLVK